MMRDPHCAHTWLRRVIQRWPLLGTAVAEWEDIVVTVVIRRSATLADTTAGLLAVADNAFAWLHLRSAVEPPSVRRSPAGY